MCAKIYANKTSTTTGSQSILTEFYWYQNEVFPILSFIKLGYHKPRKRKSSRKSGAWHWGELMRNSIKLQQKLIAVIYAGLR